MRYILLLILLGIQVGVSAQLPSGLVVLQGNRKIAINQAEMTLEMANQPFSVRYNLPQGQGSPKLSLFANAHAFERLGHETSKEDKHTFEPYCTFAVGVPYESFFVVQAEYDYQGNYYLAEYSKKIDSLPEYNQYEFDVNQVEGVKIRDLFIENLYFTLFFDKNGDFKFDEGELIKLTLHFANFKHTAEIAEDVIDLDQIDFKTFDAESFYEDAVDHHRIARGFVKKNGSQHNKYSKEDSAYVQFEPGLNSSLMKSVKFRNLYFPIMESTVTLDGHTMAVAAVTEYNSMDDVHKTYLLLEKEYGKPEKAENDNRVSATWNLPDRVIQLSIEDVVQDDDKILTRIFIASQEYVNKIKGVFQMGIWYRFD